jgi:regulator of sigma D
MQNAKQETRGEKISRWLRNLTRGLAQYSDLHTLQKRRAELEAQLREMPMDERLALVPQEETERERKELIVAYTEIIAVLKKELAVKRQAVQKAEGDIAEFCRYRSQLEKQNT